MQRGHCLLHPMITLGSLVHYTIERKLWHINVHTINLVDIFSRLHRILSNQMLSLHEETNTFNYSAIEATLLWILLFQ